MDGGSLFHRERKRSGGLCQQEEAVNLNDLQWLRKRDKSGGRLSTINLLHMQELWSVNGLREKHLSGLLEVRVFPILIRGFSDSDFDFIWLAGSP